MSEQETPLHQELFDRSNAIRVLTGSHISDEGELGQAAKLLLGDLDVFSEAGVPAFNQVRGILKAIRRITGCPEGESILVHIDTIMRRYKRLREKEVLDASA